MKALIVAGAIAACISSLIPLQAEAQENTCMTECFISWRACVRVAGKLPEPERTFELNSCQTERSACEAAAVNCPPHLPRASGKSALMLSPKNSHTKLWPVAEVTEKPSQGT